MDKQIRFGDVIKICFPDGDEYYMPAEKIAEIVSEYWEIHFNELLSPIKHGCFCIESSMLYKKRKEQAQKYEEEII